MLTVAAYLWFDPHGKHNDEYVYSVGDVKLWRDMVDRHLTLPHDFACITDNPEQFLGTGIRGVPLRRGPVRGPRFCAEKLMTFSPYAKDIGERILTMDIDCIPVGNMDALVERDEPLVLWRNPARVENSHRAYYNSSMVLITAGSRPDVWDRYMNGEAAGMPGDQDWISRVVGPDCAYWDGADGVYRLGRADTPGSGPRAVLPKNARVVFFPGNAGKPWLPEIMAECPWISAHRR